MKLKTERKIPKVSIGLPVYNAEKFLHEKIEKILSNPFKDFELIISDNSSTDSTSSICNHFLKKDQRIKFFQQKKNIGWKKNFQFVLEKSQGEYFFWSAADDKMLTDFIEKNIHVLDSQTNVVCSISQVKRYGAKINMFEVLENDSKFKKFYKKFRRHFRTYGAVSLTGTYEQKAGKFLRRSSGQSVYGIFRTNLLKEASKDIFDSKVGFELGIFLNILKFGDLHVLDETLLFCWDAGNSSSGLIESYLEKKISLQELFFPFYYHFTWCLKHLGIKFILKNIDHWIWLNCWVPILIPKEILLLLKEKIKK